MKKLLKILGIILLIVVSLWFLLELIGAPLVKKYIQREMQQHPTDTIDIGSVDFSLLPLGILIRDTRFEFHTQADSSAMLWQGNIGKAGVKGANWWGLIRGDYPKIGEIEITEGSVHLNITKAVRPKQIEQDTANGKAIQKVLIRHLALNNLDLQLQKDSAVSGLNLSLSVDSLFLDQSDSLRWDIAGISLESHNGRFHNVLTDYKLGYESCSFRSQDSLLKIGRLHMKPSLSREEFAEKYKYLKVQTDVEVKELTLTGINLRKLNKGLYAKNLLLDSVLVKVYQDTRKERTPRAKPLPSQMIAEIPFPVDVDSLQVRRGKLDYNEKLKDDLGLAYLRGDNMEVNAYPISNIGHSSCADVTLEGKVRFMGEADVTLKGVFAPDRADHDFTVEATMGPVSMPVFNPLLFPLTGLDIRNGDCQGIRLHMRGNDYLCQGKMDISYRNLKIAIPSDDKKRNLWGKIVEDVGNLILVNTRNKYKDHDGFIYYDRDMRRPFLNYWWKSIETGLKDAMIRFYKNRDEQRDKHKHRHRDKKKKGWNIHI